MSTFKVGDRVRIHITIDKRAVTDQKEVLWEIIEMRMTHTINDPITEKAIVNITRTIIAALKTQCIFEKK